MSLSLFACSEATDHTYRVESGSTGQILPSVHVIPDLQGKCLDLQVNARDFVAALAMAKTSALAELGESDMANLV